jgi:hypothetical protein
MKTTTRKAQMTDTKPTQEEKIKYVQSVYSLMGKIAGEIHDQYKIGSVRWQKAMNMKWKPLSEMFYEYVHKNKIHKSYYR